VVIAFVRKHELKRIIRNKKNDAAVSVVDADSNGIK